jgi:hypothetical protein
MATLTATIAQTAAVAEDLALELDDVSVALRDLNSNGWNFGIWDLPECRQRVAQLRQAALDVQTVALQLSQQTITWWPSTIELASPRTKSQPSLLHKTTQLKSYSWIMTSLVTLFFAV